MHLKYTVILLCFLIATSATVHAKEFKNSLIAITQKLIEDDPTNWDLSDALEEFEASMKEQPAKDIFIYSTKFMFRIMEIIESSWSCLSYLCTIITNSPTWCKLCSHRHAASQQCLHSLYTAALMALTLELNIIASKAKSKMHTGSDDHISQFVYFVEQVARSYRTNFCDTSTFAPHLTCSLQIIIYLAGFSPSIIKDGLLPYAFRFSLDD